MQIIPCHNSIELATKIAISKGFELVIPKIYFFTAKEMQITIPKILAKEVYIIQSFSASVNDALIELLLTVHAARNSGADIINVITPYLCYSRQDKVNNNASCGVQIIANLLGSSKINKIITIDFHSPSTLSLFPIPIINITIEEIVQPLIHNKLIISPDNGASRRNNFDQVIKLNKKRTNNGLSFKLHGDVTNNDCLIVDDIIDSGQTICLAAEILHKHGAKSITAFATHALLSSDTCSKINNSCINKLYISNSIQNNLLPKNTTIIDVTKIIAQKIISL